MQLEDALVENLLKTYGQKKLNVQRILDNQLFQSLPLQEKVRLIRKYQGDLGKDPRFNWSELGKAVTGASLMAATGTLVAQLIAHKGPAPFRPGPWGVGTALASGVLMGSIAGIIRGRSNLGRDKTSKDLVADPMSTLVSRTFGTSLQGPKVLNYALSHLDSAPTNMAIHVAENIHTIPKRVYPG